MKTPIWHLLSEEEQDLLKSLMPFGWRPPPIKTEKIKKGTDDQEELHLMEIDKEMRKPSRMRK